MMTAPLGQEGTGERAQGISQGLKAQRMRPRSTHGPDSGWLAGLPTAQLCSAVEPGAGVLRSVRARLKGSTTLGEEGHHGSGLLLQGIWECST